MRYLRRLAKKCRNIAKEHIDKPDAPAPFHGPARVHSALCGLSQAEYPVGAVLSHATQDIEWTYLSWFAYNPDRLDWQLLFP